MFDPSKFSYQAACKSTKTSQVNLLVNLFGRLDQNYVNDCVQLDCTKKNVFASSVLSSVISFKRSIMYE